MNNIEIFKALSGLVFAKLYDGFPLRIDISPTEIAVSLGDEFWDESLKPITENHSQYVRKRSPAGLAKPTVEWLSSAGFISFEAYRDGKFVNASLTPRGLEAIEADQARGSSLLSASGDLLKEELKDQAGTQLKSLFSQILTWSIEKCPTLIQVVSSYGQQ